MLEVDRDAYLPLLTSNPLFRELGSAELSAVAELVSERSFAAGETLIERGEASTSLFLIVSGLVRVPSVVGTQASLMMTTPEMLGIPGLIAPHRHVLTAIANTDCHTFEISMQGLRALMDTDDSFGRRLFHEVARHLWQVLDEIVADADGKPIGNYLP
ncbi:MAG: cyclic nucleotide-binding domain-containing protein [Chloroflexota bacterium]